MEKKKFKNPEIKQKEKIDVASAGCEKGIIGSIEQCPDNHDPFAQPTTTQRSS